MSTNRIKTVRIQRAKKPAPIPIQETIDKLYIRWIERELAKSNCSSKIKIMIIDAIINKMPATIKLQLTATKLTTAMDILKQAPFKSNS